MVQDWLPIFISLEHVTQSRIVNNFIKVFMNTLIFNGGFMNKGIVSKLLSFGINIICLFQVKMTTFVIT
jgi:hypothetical protein